MSPATPENGSFMVAGYVVALVVYLSYAIMLVRRQRAVSRRLHATLRPVARPVVPPPPDAAA